ncbi:hypothetical protein T4D_15820 [Trichinella pseudospiralis]|uniref:Uncharacterized protein n=1 Tax=Trichinella pseudospiralis TaxID=6337 RepID=A0A0V1F6I2_TRIPS|nr:hypothetical protein T4D_15820 [Trichinella pseudospiralis]
MAFMKSFSFSAKVFNKNWRTKMAPLALTNEQALFQKFSTLPDDICLKPAKMADKELLFAAADTKQLPTARAEQAKWKQKKRNQPLNTYPPPPPLTPAAPSFCMRFFTFPPTHLPLSLSHSQSTNKQHSLTTLSTSVNDDDDDDDDDYADDDYDENDTNEIAVQIIQMAPQCSFLVNEAVVGKEDACKCLKPNQPNCNRNPNEPNLKRTEAIGTERCQP